VTSGLRLEAAIAADAAALAALHAAAFPPAEAWGPDAIALMLGLPGGFGIWSPGQGFVLARAAGGEAEILTLAVLPAARRQGVGAALLAAALAGAAVRGAAAMFLEVAAGNVAALGLYRRLGFAEVGRRRRYYADGADALVLRRDLAADGAPTPAGE
jgi:ribosomal-protein-alanine N-acetyltransferase